LKAIAVKMEARFE